MAPTVELDMDGACIECSGWSIMGDHRPVLRGTYCIRCMAPVHLRCYQAHNIIEHPYQETPNAVPEVAPATTSKARARS